MKPILLLQLDSAIYFSNLLNPHLKVCLATGWLNLTIMICIQVMNKAIRLKSHNNPSLCRCCSWSNAPAAFSGAPTGATLGILDDSHNANAGPRGLTHRPEHYGSPRDYLSCWRGLNIKLTLRTRPGAWGRTRGRDGCWNRRGESSSSSVLLAVQSGGQLGVTARRSQQR